MLAVDEPNEVSLKPKDFDPPLKRKEATVPGYWTLDEIANELNISTRKIIYDIVGRPDVGLEPSLKTYKVYRIHLVQDDDALKYIERYRHQKSRKKS